MMVFAAIMAAAVVFGMATIPATLYLVGKELPRGVRGVIARIMWTIAAMIHGPYIIYQRDDGSVDICRALPDENAMVVDGNMVELEDEGNWSYLGKTKFGITWERSRDAFDGTLASFQQTGRRDNANGDNGDNGLGELFADGGGEPTWRLLGRKRGGYPAVTKFSSHAQGWVVDISRIVSRMRSAAGAAIADSAKRQALRDHGSGTNMGSKWIVIGIISSLLLGAISGYLMFGV